MKKTTLSFFFIIAFTLYAVLSTQKQALTVTPPSIASSLVGAPDGTSLTHLPVSSEPPTSKPLATATPVKPAPKLTSTPAPVPVTKPKGMYTDGTYNGDVADAYYGNVQVQATISGGKLTGVRFIQYPNDRGTSIEINSQAMPYLKQEAIAAQSAQVDIVSGATATSEAFQQSLSSALVQARTA